MTVSIRASLLISAFAMAALTAAFAAPDDRHEGNESAQTPSPHWTYAGDKGPEHWGELGPENSPCSAGLQQSPVDLAHALGANAPAPVPRWIPASNTTVANNGHTLQVNIANGGAITLEGKSYALKQFHFHHPSEHVIEGKTFPLEVHLVHAAPDGDLAVVGVLFEEGAANPALDPIWATAPIRAGEVRINAQIDPARLLPPVAGVYRYEGSLTTPPCSETVHWTIMSTPATASASQLAAFASLFPLNARPVQPLNRRYVLKTSG
jgi:carbonic anhydrase